MCYQCCNCGAIIEENDFFHCVTETEPHYVLCKECNEYLTWLRSTTREEDMDAAFHYFQPMFDNRQIPMSVKDEMIRIRFHHELAEQMQQQAYEENLRTMILTTGSAFDGYRVVKYLDVICEEVIFKNSIKNRFNAELEDLGNAFTFSETEMSGAGALIARARGYAKEKFRRSAAKLGANAVLGVEFESSIGADVVRVAVFGTAVVVEKIL